jgi:hypothetical protein
MFIAGGYGLFLKQEHLINSSDSRIVIPFDQWQDSIPRATNDMDLVLSLDLIADGEANKNIAKALEEEGFEVSHSPRGKSWQFFKDLEENQSVIVELHTTEPKSKISSIASNRFTVKHKPSLGDEGVHGRTNQEAFGCEVAPFSFDIHDVLVLVPHPIIWSVMKLAAAYDTWKRSKDDSFESKDRQYYRNQAIKHGNDVCRAIAMMTIEERDESNEVLDAIRETEAFEKASDIYNNFFSGEEDWAGAVLSDRWQEDQLVIIKAILSSWY